MTTHESGHESRRVQRRAGYAATTHIVKVDGKQIKFDLEPSGQMPGVTVPTTYRVLAPGVVPFEVKFPSHLRDAKQILEEVYHQWHVD